MSETALRMRELLEKLDAVLVAIAAPVWCGETAERALEELEIVTGEQTLADPTTPLEGVETVHENERLARMVWRFAQAGRDKGNPHELLSIVDIREIVGELWRGELLLPWGVVAVDVKILELAQSGVLSLHEHDFPLSVVDRGNLLCAGDRWYCGVSLRH